MVPVARRNLLAEKGRLAISVAGVAFAVLLTLLVLSLYRGWSGTGKLITRLPGDLWITQEGTSGPFNSTSILPDDAAADLGAVDGVQFVLPVYAREMSFPKDGRDLRVFFMALDAPASAPLPQDVRDRFFPRAGEVNIDSVFADDAGVGLGDVIDVRGRKLSVARVTSGGSAALTQFAFLNADDARAIFGTAGIVNFYLLSVVPGADVEAVGAAAAAVLPRAEAHTSEQFAGQIADVVEQGFLPVVGVLVGLGAVVGCAVIGLTTYTATIEKARDFGVLKALGASGMYLYRIVITQSLIVGIFGSVLGLAVSAVAANLIRRRIPEFMTDLRWTDAGFVLAGALVMAVVASWVPVRRINSIDPAMVFRA
jgi:putative ABC transport system permease protein